MRLASKLLVLAMHIAILSNPLPATSSPSQGPLQVGWARCDLTPPKLPVFIDGLFNARLSEGVGDPLTATVLVLGNEKDHVVFASADLVAIADGLRDAVRRKLDGRVEGLDPMKVVLHATHTHSAPVARTATSSTAQSSRRFSYREEDGFPVPAMTPAEYIDFAASRLADCIAAAWNSRQPGSVAYGTEEVIVGRNRRWVDQEGRSTMYGLVKAEARERFRHIEGTEDHVMNILATYDTKGVLTGLVLNLNCPSQQSETSWLLSADFWHETRLELAERLGDGVFLLPQCGPAGDISPHHLLDAKAHERMRQLRGQSLRQQIAERIADAVDRVLPVIASTANASPVLRHEIAVLQLPTAEISREEAEEASRQAERSLQKHRAELQKLSDNPAARQDPRWYVPVTRAFTRAHWHGDVQTRYQARQRGEGLTLPSEIHCIRVGDVAFASNPFEYYSDYGIEIKLRSPFIQTFLVQLAGPGTYIPSSRSVLGGGYGSTAASNPVGPEGGRVLADRTIAMLRSLADPMEGSPVETPLPPAQDPKP